MYYYCIEHALFYIYMYRFCIEHVLFHIHMYRYCIEHVLFYTPAPSMFQNQFTKTPAPSYEYVRVLNHLAFIEGQCSKTNPQQIKPLPNRQHPS